MSKIISAGIGLIPLGFVFVAYCAGICLWAIDLLWSKVIVFVLDNFQPLEYGIAGD